MNERFKELAEQARQYANSMYPSGLDIPKWGPAYHEKFAELVVKECVQICEQGTATQTTSSGAASMIKQHFGVE